MKPYIIAFLIGGAICTIGQILIDKTKLTPARILVGYVVAGVILGAIGVLETCWQRVFVRPLMKMVLSEFLQEV